MCAEFYLQYDSIVSFVPGSSYLFDKLDGHRFATYLPV